jgi:hypothetical protein
VQLSTFKTFFECNKAKNRHFTSRVLFAYRSIAMDVGKKSVVKAFNGDFVP